MQYGYRFYTGTHIVTDFISNVVFQSSIEYRDILGESCFAVSQLISHANDVFLNTPLHHFRKSAFALVEILRISSYFEVIIEKLLQRFGSISLLTDVVSSHLPMVLIYYSFLFLEKDFFYRSAESITEVNIVHKHQRQHYVHQLEWRQLC